MGGKTEPVKSNMSVPKIGMTIWSVEENASQLNKSSVFWIFSMQHSFLAPAPAAPARVVIKLSQMNESVEEGCGG